MRAALRTARTLLVTYYAYMLEYRAELWFWVLSNSLPIVMLGVWVQAAASDRFDLTPLQFARYFISVFLVRQFTIVWVIWEFEREVVEGRLSFRLLQPIHPVWFHVAAHVSERFARLPFSFGLMALFALLYPEAVWWPGGDRIAIFLAAIVAVFALRFLMQYTMALLAFWTERASALEDLQFLFYLFLSGALAPLEVYPPVVRTVAQWTPFPYLIHFPAALLVGLPVNVWRSLGVMALWGAIVFATARVLWRRGLRQYSGMGA